ncbi:MAG TPA: signal peptidase II [Thermoanaerobaculia bacterium]|nr:signal peptidase II [Thermoanaerobaculia bacterium]
MKHRLLPLPLLVVALDQWSKWWVERELAPYEAIPVVPGFFSISHVTNTGIAFGLLPSHGDGFGTFMLVLLGLLALLIVSVYFWRAPASQKLLLCALALIMGGAVGNLVDRILLHAVTDFLDVYVGSYHWPTFNVADSAITVGIGLLALETMRAAPAQSSEADLREEDGGTQRASDLGRAVAGGS